MRLQRWSALLAVLLAGGWCTPSAGQTTVTGVARDGQTGRVYAGAIVELVSSTTPWAPPLRTETDSSGRFTMVGVPAARYLLGFMHPALEDVGLSQVTRRIEVPASGQRLAIDLSPPTGADLVSLICGAEGAGRGALLGRVLAADTTRRLRGGVVAVQWEQLNIGMAGVNSGPVLRSTPVLPDGRYLLCDLPPNARILVRASGADSLGSLVGSSGVIELEFGYAAPLLHRDLRVASAAAPAAIASSSPGASTARMTGRILSDGGRPVANATVSLPDAGVSTRSDADGRFQLSGLPTGTHMVEARAIGYVPTRAIADLLPGREAEQQITIWRGAQTLDEVTVRVQTGRSDFERRRAAGIGHFVTAQDIERSGQQSLPMVLSAIPTLRMNGVETNGTPVITGRGGCTPSYFLDGQPILGAAVSVGTIRDIGGIEVYGSSSEAPPEYAGPSRAMRIGAPAASDSSSRPRNPFAPQNANIDLKQFGDVGVKNDNAFCAVILIWSKGSVR